MTTMTTTDRAATHQVLDPCLLGRPVHLLHVFAEQLRDDLAASLQQPASRRYWGAMQVGALAFSRIEGQAPAGRWLDYASGHGVIGLNLERKILLSILNNRYGRKSASTPAERQEAAPRPDPLVARVTATEERLALLLARELAQTLASRVAQNLAALALPTAEAARAPATLPGAGSGAAATDEVPLVPGAAPLKGSWVIRVALSDPQAGIEGELWFALDKRLMGDVLRGLLQPRERKAARDPRPLAAQLQLKLEGRLITKQMLLGSLFDLRVGDVIPVSMSRTEVLLDDSRLFTAAVSEFKGKLCLTSFEDAE